MLDWEGCEVFALGHRNLLLEGVRGVMHSPVQWAADNGTLFNIGDSQFRLIDIKALYVKENNS